MPSVTPVGTSGRRPPRRRASSESGDVPPPRSPAEFPDLLAAAVTTMVADLPDDLTLRQLAVLLLVHTDTVPPTVRDIAAYLRIPRPSVTRALDVLGEAGLAVRRVDWNDRRSVLVSATPKGRKLIRLLVTAMATAGEAGKSAEGKSPER